MFSFPKILLLSALFTFPGAAYSKPVASDKYAASNTASQPVMRNVIDRAHELIGTPYRWGGVSVEKGFDCSGLLMYLFRSEADIKLPRTTAGMMKSSFKAVARDKLKPGDAVFFSRNGKGRINHVGLYIGNGRFIHAPRTGKNVKIDTLKNRYWHRSYKSARRFHEPALEQMTANRL